MCFKADYPEFSHISVLYFLIVAIFRGAKVILSLKTYGFVGKVRQSWTPIVFMVVLALKAELKRWNETELVMWRNEKGSS
jgi:hypothetical protein